MDASNLAKIFSPSIFSYHHLDALQAFAETKAQTMIVQKFITTTSILDVALSLQALPEAVNVKPRSVNAARPLPLLPP